MTAIFTVVPSCDIIEYDMIVWHEGVPNLHSAVERATGVCGAELKEAVEHRTVRVLAHVEPLHLTRKALRTQATRSVNG